MMMVKELQIGRDRTQTNTMKVQDILFKVETSSAAESHSLLPLSAQNNNLLCGIFSIYAKGFTGFLSH